MKTNSLFVDTSGWMASFIEGKLYRPQARQELESAIQIPTTTIYTTDYIVAELAALMHARKVPRPKILVDIEGILAMPRFTKLFTSKTIFFEAWELLKQRPDKDWSIADAISMLHMQQLGITEILTNDHHFEQAGFIRLLL